MAMSAVLTGVLVLNNFDSVRSIEEEQDESHLWNEVDNGLLVVSDELGGLVTTSYARSRGYLTSDVDEEAYLLDVIAAQEDLSKTLTLLGVDEDPLIQKGGARIVNAAYLIIESAADFAEASNGNDELGVDLALRRLLTQHQIFRHELDVLMVRLRVLREDSSSARTVDSEQRFQLGLAVSALAMGLIGAMGFVSYRIKAHENRLLLTLQNEQSHLQAIVDCVPLGLAWKDLDRRVIGVNRHLTDTLEERGLGDATGRTFAETSKAGGRGAMGWRAVDEMELSAIESGSALALEQEVRADEATLTIRFASSPLIERGKTIGVVTVIDDISDQRQLEQQLATSGRMGMIGQLAAGVAHEINTPIQFVSDNTEFLGDSFADLLGFVDDVVELGKTVDEARVEELSENVDLAFLRTEVPGAIEQSQDGLGRVAEIVRALKGFSHPGTESSETDINELVEATVSISRGEWKFVAEMDLELDPDLPAVQCRGGEIKQVVLNMVVNAAHAVEEAVVEGQLGKIGVRTGIDGNGAATIAIWDTGAGMSPEVQERIFEQFFTSKEVGKGTGQGLSLAWEIIRRHEGSISVDSEPGVGTTFTITLPLKESAMDAQAA